MTEQFHSGPQARKPEGTEIHLQRQLNGPYRWRAWFYWDGTNPFFQGTWRWSALRKAKRHLRRLRKVDRTPHESIWA